MKRIALSIAALFLSSCACTNREPDLTLATEAEQVLKLVPDGADRVEVVVIGPPPTIYYYAPGEAVAPGYPDQVRWTLTWSDGDAPKFDRVRIVVKQTVNEADQGLLGGAEISYTERSEASGRVRKKPSADETTWSYRVVVERGTEAIGELDPDIIIRREKPGG